jgi:putative MATE family efflux protein
MINTSTSPGNFNNISKRIFPIAIPVILQSMAFYIMSFINSAFIGHYDINGLSAINNVMFPFMMLFTLLIALSQGTTVLIAHAMGAKDITAAVKIAESSMFYTQIISFGYCLFWIFFGKTVLIVMGVSEEILQSGTAYINVFSLVFLTGGLSIAAGAIFQGIGKTGPIMTNTILRAILNITLDYCLIFGNFGMPRLGLTGAAVSSVISSTICSLLLFRSAFSNGYLPITIRGILRPQKGVYKKVFIFGAQAGLEYMLWSGAQVALIRMLNMCDQLSAGLYGILNTLISLSFNLYVGVGTAAMTLVGHSCGANRKNEVLRIGNICAAYSLFLCILVSLFFSLAPKLTIGIFSNDAAVINRLVTMIPLIAIILFPKSVNVVIGNAIRGTGDVQWMLLTQIAGTIIIVSISALFVLKMQLGLIGLMYANLLDEGWRSIVNYLRFFIKAKVIKSPVKDVEQNAVELSTT